MVRKPKCYYSKVALNIIFKRTKKQNKGKNAQHRATGHTELKIMLNQTVTANTYR